MKPRKLTESEVTFTVELEPEDMSVSGHFISGDPDYAVEERELEERIITEASQGNVEAWCCIKVTASWDGFTAVDYLGACSFLEDGTHRSVAGQVSEYVDDHGMKETALERLNQAIADVFAKLEPLVA